MDVLRSGERNMMRHAATHFDRCDPYSDCTLTYAYFELLSQAFTDAATRRRRDGFLHRNPRPMNLAQMKCNPPRHGT